MNIFILDYDMNKNVQYHCDKHVTKMLIEYVQILSTSKHMHKCTIYGKMYYDLPFWSYFKWLLGLSVLMFSYGIFHLFVMV